MTTETTLKMKERARVVDWLSKENISVALIETTIAKLQEYKPKLIKREEQVVQVLSAERNLSRLGLVKQQTYAEIMGKLYVLGATPEGLRMQSIR